MPIITQTVAGATQCDGTTNQGWIPLPDAPSTSMFPRVHMVAYNGEGAGAADHDVTVYLAELSGATDPTQRVLLAAKTAIRQYTRVCSVLAPHAVNTKTPWGVAFVTSGKVATAKMTVFYTWERADA